LARGGTPARADGSANFGASANGPNPRAGGGCADPQHSARKTGNTNADDGTRRLCRGKEKIETADTSCETGHTKNRDTAAAPLQEERKIETPAAQKPARAEKRTRQRRPKPLGRRRTTREKASGANGARFARSTGRKTRGGAVSRRRHGLTTTGHGLAARCARNRSEKRQRGTLPHEKKTPAAARLLRKTAEEKKP
jgi:hypothetical protein